MSAARMKRALLLATLLTAAAAPDPQALAWRQYPGAQMPMGTQLADEQGRPVRLSDFSGRAPVIVDFGYFHCPSLCGTVRADLLQALGETGLPPARQSTVLAISIDPGETSTDATLARARDLAAFPRASGLDIHYLTGAAPALARLQNEAGFPDRFDPASKQFMHPSGIVVLTGTGRISSYLLGVGYQPGDLRAALLRAGEGGVARAALPILLLCFHFDASTGRYTLAIMKVLRLMALLTIAMLGVLVVLLNRRPRGSAA